MKISKSRRNNIIFLVLLALLLIPQTRKPIQVFLNKGMAIFGPSVIEKDKRKAILDYQWNLKNTLTNKVYNFQEAKGKVIVVNFWATWCPPCIAELPHLNDLYKDYNEEVVFLFISNEDAEVVNAFLNKRKIQIPVYKPLTKYPLAFNVSSIPRTFLIDKSGDIVIDKTGVANWNGNKVRTAIEELIK